MTARQSLLDDLYKGWKKVYKIKYIAVHREAQKEPRLILPLALYSRVPQPPPAHPPHKPMFRSQVLLH